MRTCHVTWIALLAATLGCGGDDPPKSEGSDPATAAEAQCQRICALANRAECEEAEPDCEGYCTSFIEDASPRCRGALDAYIGCAITAQFVCSDDEEPVAPSCERQELAYAACEQSAVGGDASTGDASTPLDGGLADGGTPRPDASTPTVDAGPFDAGPSIADGGPILCEPDPADDVCTTCVKGSCCAELSACGSECQKVLDCVTQCNDDSACTDRCFKASPVGAQAFGTLAGCMATRCTAACAE